MKLICNCLNTALAMKHINLSHNQIGPPGTGYLAKSLVSLQCRVKKLRINKNPIKDEGIKNIVDALIKRSQKNYNGVTYLDASESKLTNNASKIILELVEKNPFIEKVKLKGNKLAVGYPIRIKEKCKSNTSLAEERKEDLKLKEALKLYRYL